MTGRLDRLKMGKVETIHFQQFNELLRYVFQVTKKELQMVGWEEREIALPNCLYWRRQMC